MGAKTPCLEMSEGAFTMITSRSVFDGTRVGSLIICVKLQLLTRFRK